MFPTIIILITGLMGFYWGYKAQNPFTKFCSLLLSFAFLLLIVPQNQIRAYSPYLLAFASVMAGFEPGSSRRIEIYHKVFFGVFGVIFAAVALDRIITWPFNLTLWPLALVYLVALAAILSKGKKKLKTRFGTLAAWAGMALDHVIRAV